MSERNIFAIFFWGDMNIISAGQTIATNSIDGDDCKGNPPPKKVFTSGLGTKHHKKTSQKVPCLKLTANASENGWLENEFSFWKGPFSGANC